MTPVPQAYVLAGPTAAGKTDIVHLLAVRLHAAVLCADSMTVYRGMDIGTAKPSPAQRAEARYFGVDLVAPDAEFSVAEFLLEAREAVKFAGPLIVAGGSGLYIRCLLEGLREGVPADASLRAEAERLLAGGGVAALRGAVQREAPAHFAALADPMNPRRLVRAWETARAGRPVETTWSAPQPVLAGLTRPKQALQERINRRVHAMYQAGLVEESRRLREQFPSWSRTAQQAIGYAEALTVVDGRCTVARAMEQTQQRTRQLARRQMTWFRHQASVDWVDAETFSDDRACADAVMRIWEKHGPAPLHI